MKFDFVSIFLKVQRGKVTKEQRFFAGKFIKPLNLFLEVSERFLVGKVYKGFFPLNLSLRLENPCPSAPFFEGSER
ncbi:hypothetical protein D0817_04250 [Flavobacterium cupreum]|uniref:Uncharacterized protein n=1 Tax=Flavobacterium cupreum TaxID=2133766 RepID=A0A434ABX8_9FLAO|nr:hypothetical protein D0817_04250 [Flavobacterium cupreum]